MAHPLAGRCRPRPESWTVAHERLLQWALGSILAWAGRCAGFRVVVESPVGEPDRSGCSGVGGGLGGVGGGTGSGLDSDGPVVVLARHGGPGDSFALVHLLLDRYQRRVRIVLKDILQLDPALDILLNRLDCCFLPSKAGAGEDLPNRLAELAGAMHGRDALLVFPEGGNWTPGRRRRAIQRLRAGGEEAAADAAALMIHVLPPRPGGVLAVLDERPDVTVVLVAHAGLDRIVTAGQAWAALPLTTPMTVRAWPASPFPRSGHDAQLAWLTTEWAIVDEWIDAHQTATPGAGT